MPELFLKMDELVKAGKMEEAMRVQYAANDIIYKMCSGHGNMYGMIKEMLRINESWTWAESGSRCRSWLNQTLPLHRKRPAW